MSAGRDDARYGCGSMKTPRWTCRGRRWMSAPCFVVASVDGDTDGWRGGFLGSLLGRVPLEMLALNAVVETSGTASQHVENWLWARTGRLAKILSWLVFDVCSNFQSIRHRGGRTRVGGQATATGPLKPVTSARRLPTGNTSPVYPILNPKYPILCHQRFPTTRIGSKSKRFADS